MNNNLRFLAAFIDIDYRLIQSIDISFDGSLYSFHIYLFPSISCCPHCGSSFFSIKSSISRKLVGSQFNNHPSVFIIHLKRYLCKKCSASFNDFNPLAYGTTSLSKQVIPFILDDLKPYNSTYSSVARKYGISVPSVIDIFDTFVHIKRKRLPRVLLMDEFYFSRHAKYKYSCILMNFEKGYIVDIIESRRYSVLSDYFFNIDINERNSVEFICIDMYLPYKSIQKIFFKNSTLLVDHFHVTKFINDHLNNTRKRIMRKYSKNKNSLEYQLLKHEYKLLLMKKDEVDSTLFKKHSILGYTCTRLRVLEELLKIDRELSLAYTLKELYLEFDSISCEEINEHDMEYELEELISYFKTSEVKESVIVGKTLSNWKREILNSFVWIDGRRISNGMIEGKINYIKKILTNANGMRNFERARNKIIYSQNKEEKYTLTPKEKNKIKKKKK